MKKRNIMLFLVFLMIFLVGCQKGSSTDSSSRGKIFISGNDGLSIAFDDEETPERIGDNSADEFDIVINVENNGEHDIESGKIIATLQGIDRDAFSLSSLSVKSDRELNGERRFRDRDEVGEEDELVFENAKYKFDLDADFSVTMRADVCYEYKTRAQGDICLKRNANERLTNDVCDLDDSSVDIESSGAPVQVTKMTQRPSGSNKVSFTFDVEKKGSGDVFEPGTFTSVCNEQRDKKDRLKIRVTSASERISPSCNRLNGGSQGIVDLIDGKRTIKCDVSTSSLQEFAHTRPLKIELTYFYKDSEERSIIVENTEF
jgi:hypothetical protein